MTEHTQPDEPVRGSNVFIELEPNGPSVEVPAEVYTEGEAAIKHWLAAEKAKLAATKKATRRTAAQEE